LGWLRKSLALGAVTTVASFVGLGLSTFPGFDQMGWVAAVGVATALVVSVFALPPMLAAAKPRGEPAVAQRLAQWTNVWEARPRALLAGAAVVVVAGALSAGRVHWTDDVSALTKIDPALLAEDENVRGRIHRLDLSRFVVARGPDLEAALRSNDAAADRLRGLVRSEALGGFDSLHSFLWSADLQRRNLEAFRASSDLAQRVEHAFSAEGFRAGAFAGLGRSLENPPPPLRLRDLEGTAAGAAVAAQVLELPEGVAIVTFLRAVRDLPALAEAMADLPTVEVFDQKRFVESVYAEYRKRILRIVLSGTLIVFAILWARYRSLRVAAAAISPSLLTVAALTLVAAVSGTTLHLIHLLSLVLVMGMGVDYGIFTVDTERQEESMGTTQLGLLVSCLTTLFVFGSLALSSYPALRAMGLTTGLGLLFSFLFSPVAVVLLKNRRAT
jgi:predicted exporter